MPRIAKKKIVGSKKPAKLLIPSDPDTRTGMAPFPLTGPMTHQEFQVCWSLLTPRGKQKARDEAENRDLTLIGVLGTYPHLRVG